MEINIVGTVDVHLSTTVYVCNDEISLWSAYSKYLTIPLSTTSQTAFIRSTFFSTSLAPTDRNFKFLLCLKIKTKETDYCILSIKRYSFTLVRPVFQAYLQRRVCSSLYQQQNVLYVRLQYIPLLYYLQNHSWSIPGRPILRVHGSLRLDVHLNYQRTFAQLFTTIESHTRILRGKTTQPCKCIEYLKRHDRQNKYFVLTYHVLEDRNIHWTWELSCHSQPLLSSTWKPAKLTKAFLNNAPKLSIYAYAPPFLQCLVLSRKRYSKGY